MDNEMIERVAIAIKEAKWGKRIAWEACDESFKTMKRQQAIAAIKVIMGDKTYGSSSNPIIENNL